MKIKFVILFLIMAPSLLAQDFYLQLEKEAGELIQKKDYVESIQRTEKILKINPDGVITNLYHAFNLINLGRLKEAEPFVNIALELDPSDYAVNLLAGYFKTANNDVVSAKKYFSESMRFLPANFDIKNLQNEMSQVGDVYKKSDSFNSLFKWYEQTYPEIQRIPSLNEMNSNFYEAAPEKIPYLVTEFISKYESASKTALALTVYTYASNCYANTGHPSEALDMALAGYQYFKKNGYGENEYLANLALNQVMKSYMASGNYAQALQYINEIAGLFENMIAHGQDINALVMTANCYEALTQQRESRSDKEESRKYSSLALQLSEKYNYLQGVADAANSLCMSYISGMNADENKYAAYYGEMALRVSQANNLSMSGAIMSNLALAYWNLGDAGKAKCISMYRDIVEKAKADGNWSDASLSLNNLGAMFLNRGNLEEAIPYFEESASLAVTKKFSNPKDRLTYYQTQLSSYDFLIMCYAQTRNAEKTFNTMERRRSRVLAERLNHGETKKSTLTDLQNLLKPDEASIMYSVFSGHEIVILVVTKKYAQVIFHDDPQFVGDIKDKYFKKGKTEQSTSTNNSRGFQWASLGGQGYVVRQDYDREAMAPRADFNRVNDLTRKFFESPGTNDEFLMDCLSRYQKFLIVPILNRLTGIKSLLIAPDDVLSLIPFEALCSFDGKYLVEKYNIRYLHSATILQQLEERKYNPARKPLLAMGGAIYQDIETVPMPFTSIEDLNALQAEVYENFSNGTSQRKAYATMFGQHALNPLPGTLDEVKNISGNLPGSEIFAGEEMTENRIKMMSKSGQLKNYKVLHLATHGFVVPDIPELSGVAMCIFQREQDGEDGFLNATEITNLQMNADLTVLSACQTAQGKIYSGEGVTGLTQSLIIAGSNAALVSLWPVNDTSTMLFMSSFYKEVAKGKPYIQIVNELKRKFIKGDFGKEFQHPNFWAPFIYYGK